MKGILKYIPVLSFLVLFAACKNDSKPAAADTTKVEESTNAATGATSVYQVSSEKSRVNWEGSKPTGAHSGTINIKNGKLNIDNGEIVSGDIVIDMNSITVTDLEGDSKAGLEAHLKGMRDEGEEDHFFNVAKFPTAAFKITKVAKLANDENASHLVYGDLTIKGITEQVGFKASIDSNNGVVSVNTPEFKIDRTKWGVNYGSAKIFDGLKDKVINDNISLSLSVVATQ